METRPQSSSLSSAPPPASSPSSRDEKSARLAEVVAAADARDAARFCAAILPAVSRTFALGIRVLPGDLGQAVLDAYLLCRIADTVEDAPGIEPNVKAALFDDFLLAFDDATALQRFLLGVATLGGEPAHLLLTQNSDLVFEHFSALPQSTRVVVRRCVTEMSVGMRKFVLLYPHGIRIQTIDEYKEYCYYVAGTVGYMLTDLWHEYSPSISARRHAILRERCRAFAEALQTVNILKDVAVDVEQENSIYIPEELLRAHGSTQRKILAPELLANNRAALSQLIQLAWHDLEEAKNYLLLIPRRAVSIRLFCILPLLLAYATLRDLVKSSAMLHTGGSVKISRREVKSLLMTGSVLVLSNWAVRRLVERVRRKAFELAFA
jgi:farnesyl-diphosphate farnesyltransferase